MDANMIGFEPGFSFGCAARFAFPIRREESFRLCLIVEYGVSSICQRNKRLTVQAGRENKSTWRILYADDA